MNKMLQKYKSLSISLKASLWFLICSMLQKGISVFVTPVFTRLLTTEQYGLVNVYTSWREIITIFITLKLADGVMGPGLVKEDHDKLGFVSSMHGLLFTLIIFGSILFGLFHVQLKRVTGLSGIILSMMIVQMWAQATFQLWAKEQRINFHYKALVFLTLTVAVLRPALGILVVSHTKDKATARIIEMTLVDFSAYFALFFISLKKGKKFYSKKNWQYALGFNIPLIPHFLSQTVLNSADRIMIDRMINTNVSGIYSLAYQISVITVLFNNAMLQAMSPWTFSKLKSHQVKDISRIGFIALALIASVNLLFIAFAPELVNIFAPTQYSDAIWIIPPITMSVFFQFSYLLFADIELYNEKTKSITVSTTGGAILNVLLNFIFIRKYGYYAAGYTTLFCYFAIASFHYVAMRKMCLNDLNGFIIYPLKTWAIMSGIFLAGGFGLLLSYYNTKVRWGLIILILACTVSQWRRILAFIKLVRR